MVRSLILMVNTTTWEENRHVVLQQPLGSLKVKNRCTFTATELVGVQAAAGILTANIMPIVRMMRSKAWPPLFNTIVEWMVEFESTQTGALRMERMSWRQHKQTYNNGLLGVCLRMRWASGKWVQKHFGRMCSHFRLRLLWPCHVRYGPAWKRMTQSCVLGSMLV